MKKLFFSLTMLAAMATFFSCEKTTSTPEQESEWQQVSITPVGVDFESCLLQNIDQDQLVVINSQNEFASFFPDCAVPPTIDFETKSLFAIHGLSTSGIYDIEARCECCMDTLNVILTVKKDMTCVMMPWQYAFSIDKLLENQIVTLTIDYTD
ncbi:MAG: hypothetical protein IJR04_06940 [Bacteroidales bacterium]|nr:hypothetical protein [Bacteroidales bacterium]